MSNLKLFGYGVLGIFAIGALGVVAQTVTTVSSVATAPGRVITKTLETNNILSSYERFRDLNGVYQGRLAQVKAHKGVLEAETDTAEKRRLRVELAAMQQSCRDTANSYNADASKMNKAIFRADAPASLNPADCE